jgi:hypothetical protein
MDTLAGMDENECIIQGTLAKLSGNLESLVTTLAATTDRHDALLMEISVSVQKHSLRVGWRNFFSSCAVVSDFCFGGK